MLRHLSIGLLASAVAIAPLPLKAQECEEASIDAMTDGHTPSDDNEKRRLDPTGNACVDLPSGGVDLLNASSVQCSSNGDHGEAILGRHLGREHEVSADQSPQTPTSTPAGNSAAVIDHHLGGHRFQPPTAGKQNPHS